MSEPEMEMKIQGRKFDNIETRSCCYCGRVKMVILIQFNPATLRIVYTKMGLVYELVKFCV